MKYNFTNISDNSATMLIYKHIGFDDEMGQGIDGFAFAQELLYLNDNYPTLDTINVRINSVGGSVSEGFSICSAILNSKIQCNTIIDGMAYSMAGVIAMCGKKRSIRDYGTFMMHNPQGNSNVKVMEMITESLATIFEQTSGLTLDRCKDLMAMETWMSAQECCDGLGFEVINTGAKMGVPPPITEVTNLFELQNIYNKYINKKTMIKVTNFLNLKNDASEEAIVESISEIQAAVESVTAEKTVVETENETLKAELEAAKLKLKEFEEVEATKEVEAIEAIVNAAITEGKVTAESKDKWVNRGLKSTELNELFADLKTTPVHVAISNVITDKAKEVAEDRSNWTFTNWERKDPKGLADLMVNNKPAFEELLGTIPTNIKSKK